MFEEMSEPGLAGPLVLGTHVIPDAHGHERYPPVLVHDDVEAVWEDALREVNHEEEMNPEATEERPEATEGVPPYPVKGASFLRALRPSLRVLVILPSTG
jgi:hypothetical protein